MKKLTRAIVLVCIFATILSSVAFAAVLMPPRNQTYVVVPCDQYDFGYPDYPDGCVEGKVPVRYEGVKSARVADHVNFFDEVYTIGGEIARAGTQYSYTNVRLTYDDTVYDVQGYIRADNLVPAVQMRRVNAGLGGLNYYDSLPAGAATDFDISLSRGILTTGSLVRFLSAHTINGVNYEKVRVFFPERTGAKSGDYFVKLSGLGDY